MSSSVQIHPPALALAVGCVSALGFWQWPLTDSAGPGLLARHLQAPSRAEANDNRSPAGLLRDGTLEVALVITDARWYPEADAGPSQVVQASPSGRPPRNPGPRYASPPAQRFALGPGCAPTPSCCLRLPDPPRLSPRHPPCRPGATRPFASPPARRAPTSTGAPPRTRPSRPGGRRQPAPRRVHRRSARDRPASRPGLRPGRLDRPPRLRHRDHTPDRVINGLSWPHTERFATRRRH